MIQIQLQRTRRKGKAIVGKMTIPFSHFPVAEDEQDATVATLENADYIIPAGTYHLVRTFSPKFKKQLPLLEDVPDYSDTGVTGVPGANQQSVCDGESRGRSCPVDLAERYQQYDLVAERAYHSFSTRRFFPCCRCIFSCVSCSSCSRACKICSAVSLSI